MAPELWFSYQSGKAENFKDSFYDLSDQDWVQKLESNYDVIKEEINIFINSKKDRIRPYYYSNLVSRLGGWKSFAFYVWSWPVKENIETCPRLITLLDQIPNLVSASVSILEPNVTLNAHVGDTNGVYRVHFGIDIPAELPDCGMEVSGEQRSWENGKVLAFNDAGLHKAWNNTDKTRYIMILDIIKTPYIGRRRMICAKVLGTLATLGLAKKISVIKRYPGFIGKLVLHSATIAIRFLLFIKRY